MNFLPSNVSARIAVSRWSPKGHRRLRTNRDRCPCLSPAIRRRRYQRTCTCQGGRTFTAPPAPKLIPKGRYGISLWVEILLDKYFTYRPTERLLNSWRLLGLDLAPGTITDGLRRLEILLRPIYEALAAESSGGFASG